MAYVVLTTRAIGRRVGSPPSGQHIVQPRHDTNRNPPSALVVTVSQRWVARSPRVQKNGSGRRTSRAAPSSLSYSSRVGVENIHSWRRILLQNQDTHRHPTGVLISFCTNSPTRRFWSGTLRKSTWRNLVHPGLDAQAKDLSFAQ